MILNRNKFWINEVSRLTRKLKKENSENVFLSNDGKTALFLKWKNEGCIKSRDKLLSTMYPLVLQQVHEKIYRGGSHNIPVEDLEQEANIALLDALEEYDPEKGTLPTFFRSRLPKYFYPAIKLFGNFIKHPDNILKEINIEQKAFDAFVKEFGMYPNIGQTFTLIVNNKEVEVVFGKNKINNVISGNTPLVIDDNYSDDLIDTIGEDDENIVPDNDYSLLNFALKSLTEREQEIIHYEFQTQMECQDIIYRLKPRTAADYKRLYERAKNIIEIEMEGGKQIYTFFVYEGANKRQKNSINETIIKSSTHPFEINYQKNSQVCIKFEPLTTLTKVKLNGKDVLDKLNKDNIFNLNEYTLNLDLKVGTIYSANNYHLKVLNIKDKLRKKIVKNEKHY